MKTRSGRYSDNRKGRSHTASEGRRYVLEASYSSLKESASMWIGVVWSINCPWIFKRPFDRVQEGRRRRKAFTEQKRTVLLQISNTLKTKKQG